MPSANPHGDLVLTDLDALRAVAEPQSYALLRRLQREGSASIERLAADLGASPDELRARLDVLAGYGVVEESDGTWRAVSTGLLIDVPDDTESQAAARLITTQMVREAAAVPAHWWDADEPRLPDEWRRAAGVLNMGLWLTPEELQTLTDQFEELTAPYAKRAEHSDDARRVRVQVYLMPTADDAEAADALEALG
ncbi:HVO_A0114 family putative DNA-binding protein [Streptacidiphilus cavernicola]|uniref:ArsR family transcriptional regulator n=1 Tax=Streptacidiphilus cavernicola TaxID=3342716 RepID=A0ABV6W1Z0_9ACTN